MKRLILLDLDGTLLRSDKTISAYSLSVLEKCRKKGCLIGISTARGESNARRFLSEVKPEVIISSGGALVSCFGEIVRQCVFSAEETEKIIAAAFALTDHSCEITVDTPFAHYWNYKTDPHILSPDWGETVYTDYSGFREESLKICVELPDSGIAEKIAESVPDCDFARFSDGNWYKFSKKQATKAAAVSAVSERLGIPTEQMTAFGDDYVDLEMLRICGCGVAMGNAVDEVKRAADDVAETNDRDGAARYLAAHVLGEESAVYGLFADKKR